MSQLIKEPIVVMTLSLWCLKSISQASHLKMHMRIHTGEKLFPCDKCPKFFCRVGHLKEHRGTYSGESQFTCDLWRKLFSQAGDLKKLIITNTGEKHFLVINVLRYFSRVDHLKRHKDGSTCKLVWLELILWKSGRTKGSKYIPNCADDNFIAFYYTFRLDTVK